MINAVGLQNKGVDYFVEHIYPTLTRYKSEIIVNVSGKSVADYQETARRLAHLERIRAIEVNISCPNVKAGGMAFGTTCAGAAEVTAAVRKAWPRHMMVKLSPNVTDITEIAAAVEGAGADSVSLINTLLAMVVDVERRRPAVSTVTGGLSGTGRASGGRAHGVAGCAPRGHPRGGTRRHHLRRRRPAVYHGRRVGGADRHLQLR